MPRRVTCAAIAALALALPIGCSDDDGASDDAGEASQPMCLDSIATTCKDPLYDPTYDNIFDGLLAPTCGADDNCHGGSKPQADLHLSDRDEAYQYLLGKPGDGHARVIPGKPQCSLLMARLDSNDPDFRMPPHSDPIDESNRCAVRQWIAKGALRR